MTKYAAALFLAVSLLVSCARSDVVVITPLNSYTVSDITYRADALIREHGMFPQHVRASARAWENVINEVIREIVFDDLSRIHADEINSLEEPVPTESEIRLRYETLLASQQQFFTQRRDIVSAAINYPRDTILYFPSGLKWVRLFTVPFEPEVRGRAAIFLHENRITDYERVVDGAAAEMEPQLAALRQRLQVGVSFDALAEEHGGVTELLVFNQDTRLLSAKFRALNTFTSPGDIVEYNTFQGRVFMLFVREPEHVVVPFEEAREELSASLAAAQRAAQHEELMERLLDNAISNRTIRVLQDGLDMANDNRISSN